MLYIIPLDYTNPSTAQMGRGGPGRSSLKKHGFFLGQNQTIAM